MFQKITSNYKLNHKNDISLLRVVSMFLIILCHIIKYYDFIPGSKILGQVFNVGVEIFFLISGYLYAGKMISFYLDWYKERIRKIYFPVLIIFSSRVSFISTL